MDWSICRTRGASLTQCRIQPATRGDLLAANTVIERATMAWPLPDKLKRLVVPVLRYDEVDSDCFEIFVCRSVNSEIGVLALDFGGDAADLRRGEVGLHGLYVDPRVQGQGLGRRLVAFAELESGSRGYDAMGIRAERISREFFERCGYAHLPPANDDDYPYRYRKSGLIQRYSVLSGDTESFTRPPRRAALAASRTRTG